MIPKNGLRPVRRQLKHLKMTERRRSQKRSSPFSAGAAEGKPWSPQLPTNDELEFATAHTIMTHKDARASLDFTHKLAKGTLLSLASPVGWWDPLDVKPQVFALDTYIALPVFTSLPYLQSFCHKFKLAVRDPAGNLWADGTSAFTAPPVLVPPSPPLHQTHFYTPPVRPEDDFDDSTTIKASRSKQQNAVDAVNATLDADSLFGMMGDSNATEGDEEAAAATSNNSRSATRKGTKKEKTARLAEKREQRRLRREERRQEEAHADATRNDTQQKLWHSLEKVQSFRIGTASALPTFGPFIRPYFVGYFADIRTLLHNVSIVPHRVNLVLNPGSPLEFVLVRQTTERLLSEQPLLQEAYKNVETQLRHEFHVFFSQHCPDVVEARSLCLPHTQPGTTKVDDLLYDIFVIIGVVGDIPAAFDSVMRQVQQAKHRGQLIGHSSLILIPLHAAESYLVEGSSVFYLAQGDAYRYNSAMTAGAESSSNNLGVFAPLGPHTTVSTRFTGDTLLTDPTNQVSEAHGMAAARRLTAGGLEHSS